MKAPRQSIVNDLVRFLKTDLSLSLTLSYILLMSLGILYNFHYYRYFGIDILPYCDLTDFLVTPLREPMILIFFVGNLFLIYLITLWDDYIYRRFPNGYQKLSIGLKPDSPYYEAFRRFSFLIVLVVYLYISIDLVARLDYRKLRMPDAPQVELLVRAENEGLQIFRHVLVGKVGNVLVVKADTARRKAIIFPMESIHSIRPVVLNSEAVESR